jgi:NhaP-type Na+/H+ or K+/H+ antiporter
MSRLVRALIGLVAGYIVGAALGLLAVQMLSSNRHDLGVEAVMTAVFAAGPLGAVVGALVGALMRKQPAAEGS